MELKTLFYIAIGIIWLISKFLQKDKDKPVSTGKPSTPSAPESFPVPMVVQRTKKSTGKRVKSGLKTNREIRPEPTGPEEKVVNYENYYSSHKPLFDEGAVMQEVQVLESDENAGNSLANQLHGEIKNGTFDWKRAVVINELLRHQHFR